VAAGVELEAVFVAPGFDAEAAAWGAPVSVLAPGVLERTTATVTPQAALAVARGRFASLDELVGAAFVVVAAGLADPGNLGTILRVAEAAGAAGVVLTEGSVDPWSPKVVRASAGALFHLPLVVDVPLDRLADLGLPLLAAAATGGTPYDAAPLDPPVAVVLGNEAHGLPPDLEVDGVVSIPHAGRTESLNVAMAAAIVAAEAMRQLNATASGARRAS